MKTPELTELQKTQAAYAHFTLAEWRLLAQCVHRRVDELLGSNFELDPDVVKNILAKFPSAVL